MVGCVHFSCAFPFSLFPVHSTLARLISGGSFVPVLDLWSMAFVFLLATFVGFQVIQNVSRLLHTPLMSLTNAISAIAVVGSIIIAGEQKSTFSTILGTVAVAASVTNIVSGFLITDRMLKMFRDRRPKS
jgi:proton-translocating NAD(P)+ transhydrogenase subunit alpha